MIRRWIQSLRHKPKAVRDNVAVSAAGGITAVVLVAWLIITPSRVETIAEGAKEQSGAFSLIVGRIKNQTAAIADNAREFSAVTDELVAPEEERRGNTSATSSLVASSTASTSSESSFKVSATTTSSSTEPVMPRTVRIATTTVE